ARWWAQRAHRDGRDDLADRFESIASAALDTTPGECADDVAVVTGAGSGSIAADAVAGLLAGGATVIATTSALDRSKLAFYRDLYRRHARAGARLWVVPANMGSYTDVDALASWICEEQTEVSGGVSQVVKPADRKSTRLN